MFKKKCTSIIENMNAENNASTTSLNVRNKDIWLIKASQCDYQELCKLARNNPDLPKVIDPTTGYTALHWAAKTGNQAVAKLVAGTYKLDVNVKTYGGYTPLHIAAQHGKTSLYDLLIEVYNADPNVRDYSGKKPFQYLKSNPLEKQTSRNRESLVGIDILNTGFRHSTGSIVKHLLEDNSGLDLLLNQSDFIGN